MNLRATSLSLLALAVALLAACKDGTSVSHDPTHIIIISGSGQVTATSTALDSSLVVQVLDGVNKPVSNVALSWNVVGGGTLSSAATTTDGDGKSSVKWTLGPNTGTQVVTVTTAAAPAASVSFIASNGATISGTVTSSNTLPFGATFSRSARGLGLNASRSVTRHPSPNRIIVGFKSGMLGVAAAGSNAYRSISVAQSTLGVMRSRSDALIATHPMIRRAELSPALVAARYEVVDSTQIDAAMAVLRADPNVAWVERDEIVSVRDGAPRPMSANLIPGFGGGPSSGVSAVSTKLPNDPAFYEQGWMANMLDLPRAWAITTGSAAVTVAVIDMGIRFDHADVKPNLTADGYDFVSQVGFGTTETICASGTTPAKTFTTIDGDGDGPDADPTDPDDLEFDTAQNCWVHNTLGDHGLWTAGIIGAVGNEGVGVAGVNWTVKIRPIRVLGITGDGTNFDIAQGVLYAAGLAAPGAGGTLVKAATAAPVINMSLGGTGQSNTLQTAVAAAVAQGSLIVASAGNDGLDVNTYPAAYPNVMGVAAVGMDGNLATYSNAGTFISVAAPGGDFRLDDNGGGGVLGPGWDFANNRATYLFGYGTSASAPFVSGIAALMLAKEPGLTAAQIRSRIETYATRNAGLSRSDTYGWGIANAYNALVQQNGPTRATIARLLDATTGTPIRTAAVDANGNFVFSKVANGTYYLQAGDDEAGDGTIGVIGRRFAWAGTFGKPTVFNVDNNASSAAIVLGIPIETEPNDDVAHANMLSVGSWVAGTITTPDVRDVYAVQIATAGQYTFETSGLVGSCGLGVELDTFLSVASSSGAAIGSNDNFTNPAGTGRFCSRVQATLQPGLYYVTVTGTAANGLSSHGRYRLEVRAGG